MTRNALLLSNPLFFDPPLFFFFVLSSSSSWFMFPRAGSPLVRRRAVEKCTYLCYRPVTVASHCAARLVGVCVRMAFWSCVCRVFLCAKSLRAAIVCVPFLVFWRRERRRARVRFVEGLAESESVIS